MKNNMPHNNPTVKDTTSSRNTRNVVRKNHVNAIAVEKHSITSDETTDKVIDAKVSQDAANISSQDTVEYTNDISNTGVNIASNENMYNANVDTGNSHTQNFSDRQTFSETTDTPATSSPDSSTSTSSVSKFFDSLKALATFIST